MCSHQSDKKETKCFICSIHSCNGFQAYIPLELGFSVCEVLLEEQEHLLEFETTALEVHHNVLPSPGSVCGTGPCLGDFLSSPNGTPLLYK